MPRKKLTKRSKQQSPAKIAPAKLVLQIRKELAALKQKELKLKAKLKKAQEKAKATKKTAKKTAKKNYQAKSKNGC